MRNYLFDNIKGVLIFFVVSAHFIRVGGSFHQNSFGGVYYIIAFSFIMQGFLFVSGYFSKNVDKCRAGAVKNFLLPYFIMMPIMYLIRLGLFGSAHLNFSNPTMALWFLLVMFAYRFFIKDLSKVPGIVPISFAVLLLSGCVEFLGIKYALGRICAFLIFFILGYKFEWKHIEKIRRIPNAAVVVLLILLTAFSVYMGYDNRITVEMWLFRDSYATYGFGYIEGMLIRLMIAIVSCGWLVVWINLLPEKETFLSVIGQRTMTVYLLHIPIRYIIKWSGVIGHGNFVYYGIIFAAAIATIFVFSRKSVDKAYSKALDFIYDTVIMGPIKGVKKCLLK